MCGKLRAKPSWTVATTPEAAVATEEESAAYRVMANLPVIVFDGGDRQVLPMRWGFPDRRDWRRPQPIHAHAETVDELRTFRDAFNDGPDGHALTLLGPWRRQREAAQLTSGPTLHHYGLIASM